MIKVLRIVKSNNNRSLQINIEIMMTGPTTKKTLLMITNQAWVIQLPGLNRRKLFIIMDLRKEVSKRKRKSSSRTRRKVKGQRRKTSQNLRSNMSRKVNTPRRALV